MPIGTSDGQQFESALAYELGQPTTSVPQQQEEKDNDHVHVIRHGSTDYNSDEKVRSWSNVPLNEEGKAESKQVADKLSDSGIEVLFHSDLDRAADTATDIAGTTGAEKVSMPEFRSWNAGDLTGKHYSEATPVMRDYAENKPDEPLPGGESFNQFKNRVQEGLAKAELHANGQQAGIVTHRGVERLLNALEHPMSDHVDLKEFFADGEDTGSHQKMRLFGKQTSREQYIDQLVNMFENGPIRVNEEGWDYFMKNAPQSANIEDRRDEKLTWRQKIRYFLDNLMHRNLADDIRR